MQSISQILSSINDAVWSFDLTEKKFLYVNSRLANLYEIPLKNIQEHPSFWLEFIHPSDYQYVLTETRGVYKGKEVDLEYRLVINGKTKWVQDKKVVIFDEGGKSRIMSGIISDITERKNIEINLSVTEKTFRYLFINNPNPLWIYDISTLKFLAVNHAAISKYGYSREEFLSMTIADIRPPEDLNDLFESVKNIRFSYFNSGKTWRHLKKNGELIYADVSGHGINHNGAEAEIVMAHDVTEQVLSKQKITLAKENLDALINNIDDQIWSIDASYNILSTNNSFKSAVSGLIGREVKIGESIFIPEIADEEKKAWKKYYDRALQGEAYQFIGKVSILGEEPFFAETKLNPIRNNQEVIGVACISSNIQERLETQKRIMDQNKKLLELISIASHEIRGPVASLLGLADVFNMTDYSDPFNAEVIDLVKGITTQLDELIHTLVDKTYALQQENQIKYGVPYNQLKHE